MTLASKEVMKTVFYAALLLLFMGSLTALAVTTAQLPYGAVGPLRSLGFWAPVLPPG